MAEIVPLGEKSLFLPIDPRRIVHDRNEASLSVQDEGSGGVILVVFPARLVEEIPRSEIYATITGQATLRIEIGEDCYARSVEIVEAESIAPLLELPASGARLAAQG